MYRVLVRGPDDPCLRPALLRGARRRAGPRRSFVWLDIDGRDRKAEELDRWGSGSGSTRPPSRTSSTSSSCPSSTTTATTSSSSSTPSPPTRRRGPARHPRGRLLPVPPAPGHGPGRPDRRAWSGCGRRSRPTPTWPSCTARTSCSPSWPRSWAGATSRSSPPSRPGSTPWPTTPWPPTPTCWPRCRSCAGRRPPCGGSSATPAAGPRRPAVQHRRTIFTGGVPVKLLTDAYDVHNLVVQSLEATRGLLTDTLDTYRGAAAERQAQAATVLTVYAAIMLPLSLITSWYGMNFSRTCPARAASRWGWIAVTGADGGLRPGVSWVVFVRAGLVGRPRLRHRSAPGQRPGRRGQGPGPPLHHAPALRRSSPGAPQGPRRATAWYRGSAGPVVRRRS